MSGDLRDAARNFLIGEQLLAPEEAEQALAVAATVLGQGLARLDDAAVSGDTATCASTAHALKGNLLNLGLGKPAQTACQLETLARNGETAAVRTAAAALARALSPLLDQARPRP